MTATQSASFVAGWLYVCATLVFFMIVLGGLTRLTQSGLSMVEWQPVAGIVPPIGEQAWQEEFALYQQSPEYLHVNAGMSLGAFKRIFWMEYAHRVLGRIIGLVFFLPGLYFLLRRRLSAAQIAGLSTLFVLGALQGLLGWYMVKSGLVDQPHVSQYRLTAHLSLAFLLYAGLLWGAMSATASIRPVARSRTDGLATARIFSVCLLCFVFLMIVTGGFMAGTHAGRVYNTFPLIDGALVPDTLWALQPQWRNLFENVVTIQFQHRSAAILTLLLALSLWWSSRRLDQHFRKTTSLLAVAVLIQAGLGITTLLAKAPVSLAAIHQAVAAVVFTFVLFVNYRLFIRT